jgi:hypothetical protein
MGIAHSDGDSAALSHGLAAALVHFAEVTATDEEGRVTK